MLEKKFCTLKTGRELLAGHLLDDARASEADHRTRFGEDHIGDGCETRSDAAVTGVDQYADEGHAGLGESFHRYDRFRELEEREDSFVHAGAAGAGEDDEGASLVRRALGCSGELFAEDRTHAGPEKTEFGDRQPDRETEDGSSAGDERLAFPRTLTCVEHFLRIRFVERHEVERVGCHERWIPLLETPGVNRKGDALSSREPGVKATARTHKEVPLELASVDQLPTARALMPEPVGDGGARGFSLVVTSVAAAKSWSHTYSSRRGHCRAMIHAETIERGREAGMGDVAVMILAGGQGERLSILSRQRAKPAVPFGGKYRIIDFALSNCVNSGLYDVAVLTQYRPHSLNEHIGHGRPWDLDRERDGGVVILQPYLGRSTSGWYRGTADAVYHNLFYITRRQYRDVLILAGDHVYAMDYRPMIAHHRARDADVTIAVQPVAWSEVSRFGVVLTDQGDWVVDFEEKPRQPRSNLVSMGIYLFRRDVLLDLFLHDHPDAPEFIDFGKDVIPYLIRSTRVSAYRFEGYWQDVGTVQSYWEANMALLEEPPKLNLYDPNWRIHTRSEERPPAKILEGASVVRSLISHGCIIDRATVIHSVLSPGVIVQPGAVIRDSIVMTDTIVGPGATLDRCIVDKQVRIGEGAYLGWGTDDTPNWLEPTRLNTGITLVGRNAVIPPRVRIGRNVLIGPDVKESDFPGMEIPSGETVNPLVTVVWS